MREVAVVSNPVGEVCRVMLYEARDGAYLFLYRSAEDEPCIADNWFATGDDAVECARRQYEVRPDDWQVIPDPAPGCRHDLVAGVSVSGNAACAGSQASPGG